MDGIHKERLMGLLRTATMAAWAEAVKSGRQGRNTRSVFPDRFSRDRRFMSAWMWFCSGGSADRPQFCDTSMATNNLSGVTLPEMVAVTLNTSPAGTGSEKVTVVVPAPLGEPSSWKSAKSADHR